MRRWRLVAGLALILTAVAAVQGASAATGTRQPTLHGARLYRSPDTDAQRALRKLRATDPAKARLVAKIAAQPEAVWLGDWVPRRRVRAQVSALVTRATRTGRVATLVIYDIPIRDCRGYSGGGATSAAAYRAFVDQVAAGIGSRPAGVILEPDALAGLSCLSVRQQATRLSLLRYAVRRLASGPRTAIYLDAGHRNWQPPAVMATRLHAAGVALARGFSLNVANFDTTASEVVYGRQISLLTGGKHFVIDTGRNGAGPAKGAMAWCNPAGRALGQRPTTHYPVGAVDALLWIKPVGESDGSCGRGEPSAGHWWLSYALGLARRAAW